MTCSRQAGTGRSAFSLLEVVVSIGIIVFAMIPLVGLLSSGLRTQGQSAEQARAIHLMGALSSGIRSASKSDSGLRFGAPFPTNLLSGGPIQQYGFTDGGSLLDKNDTTTPGRRGSVVVLLPALSGQQQSLRAYVTVAWPASARWEETQWTAASGSLESVVCFQKPD